jgi:hypothetical protein
MLAILLRLPTARAALLALVGALLVFLRQTGIAVPEGLDETAKVTIDTLLSFLTLAGSLSMMHRAQPPAPKAPPPAKHITMTTGAIVLFVALLSGCAGSFEEAKVAGHSERFGASPNPTAYCRSLDSQHRVGGLFGKGFAVAGGSAGAATLAKEDKDWRIGMAITSMASAVIAAGAIFYSEDAASSWSRDCR